MADYNVKLSELHQRVWQDVLGLSVTIDEHGWIHVGELTIHLREYTPEGMNLHATVFEDFTDKAPAAEDLMRICNSVNMLEDAKLTVLDPYSTVNADLYLLLAEPGRIPDEALLRAVIGPAMSRIEVAAKEFATELQKLS